MQTNISGNLDKVKQELPENVTLVAVSKTRSVEEIMEAYHAGQRIFGENKVQEMEAKYPELPKDIEWHMIGHLQRNKVKYMAPFVSLVHAVDSLRLLKEINKEAKKNNRSIKCLLQVKIAEEESKFGMEEHEVKPLLNSEEIKKFQNIEIVGLMGMATFTDNKHQISKEFSRLKSIYRDLQDEFNFQILSMGMSGDYQIAIENGSNMVRIGSAIFGERNY